MLHRADFGVHTVEPSAFLHDLVLSTSFELIIVAFPLHELVLAELLEAIRNEGSACRNAGLLLLAEPERVDDAQAMVDAGVNRAVCADWNEARLWRAISDLLDIAPRISMRVLLHAQVEVTSKRSRSIYQTVNVSRSGALLEGRDVPPPGTSFDFLFRLPGGGLIDGAAEVVRRTDPVREGLDGIGTRFMDIREPGRERLNAHIKYQMERGSKR
jgi:hypothetical protein